MPRSVPTAWQLGPGLLVAGCSRTPSRAATHSWDPWESAKHISGDLGPGKFLWAMGHHGFSPLALPHHTFRWCKIKKDKKKNLNPAFFRGFTMVYPITYPTTIGLPRFLFPHVFRAENKLPPEARLSREVDKAVALAVIPGAPRVVGAPPIRKWWKNEPFSMKKWWKKWTVFLDDLDEHWKILKIWEYLKVTLWHLTRVQMKHPENPMVHHCRWAAFSGSFHGFLAGFEFEMDLWRFTLWLFNIQKAMENYGKSPFLIGIT